MSRLVGDVVVDILVGLVTLADILVAIADIVANWRFVVCFAPAFALALVLFFLIPDRLAGIRNRISLVP